MHSMTNAISDSLMQEPLHLLVNSNILGRFVKSRADVFFYETYIGEMRK